jgi:2,4-dienoyl-CoA reductase-like NADH-dependent reductase (Old Yellow Enzyme family)
MTSPLAAPFDLGPITLKNRIVMAPLTRGRAATDRIPSDIMAEYYTQRASAGLIISEATAISEQGFGWVGAPGIYSQAMVEGWKKVTEGVHAAGGRIFLQLWHMGRASHSSFHNGQPPVAASAIAIGQGQATTASGKQDYEMPRALETAEVEAIVGDYGRAATNAIAAGFDGVELHAANGYLVDNFLQSRTNHRTDKYGGSVENRSRFLLEITETLVSACGAARVGVRLSPIGVFNDMGSPDFREQFTHAATGLNRFGLAYLHVMDGLAFGFHQHGEPMTLRDFRKVFSGPLMGNCGYNKDAAEAAVSAGDADLIAFGRDFISNPDLADRLLHGWPLAAPAGMETWYSPGTPKGYTDFPKSDRQLTT